MYAVCGVHRGKANLKITHIAWDLRGEMGGPVRMVKDLCATLGKRGHQIQLLAARTDDQQQPATSGSNLHVKHLEPSILPLSLLSRRGLREARRLVKDADLVHLHVPWRAFNLQLSHSLADLDIPYVLTTHGALNDWAMRQKKFKKEAYLHIARRRLFGPARQIHFTSPAEEAQALTILPEIADKTEVLPCLIDLAPYRSLPGSSLAMESFPCIRRNVPKILFMSRLHPSKGLETLLAAAGMLRKRGVNFQLLVAGPTRERYLQRMRDLAAQLGVAANTEFLGMVSGQKKLALYQAANVFALPTFSENFGLVLAESLACGTPVVTTRGTDIWRDLQNAGGQIIERTPEAFADRLEQLLTSPAEAVVKGTEGRDYIHSWLDTDKVASDYESFYSKAAGVSQSPELKLITPKQVA